MGLEIQGEDRTVTTWESTKTKINGLWPSASWNPEERDLWKNSLYGLDQWALCQALEQVAKTYSREKPALRWVLDAYKQVKQDAQPKPDPNDRIETIVREEQARDHWATEARRNIRALTSEELEAARVRIKQRVGFDIDTQTPVDEWTYIALGFMQAELEETHA